MTDRRKVFQAEEEIIKSFEDRTGKQRIREQSEAMKELFSRFNEWEENSNEEIQVEVAGLVGPFSMLPDEYKYAFDEVSNQIGELYDMYGSMKGDLEYIIKLLDKK